MKLFEPERISRLQAGADGPIYKTHKQTRSWSERRNTSTRPPEEDYVAALILQALPQIGKRWRPLFHQWGMHVSLIGVFCHQTPRAKFKRNGKVEEPELADLLIVRRHTYLDKSVKQVAVLVQAKMSATGEVTLPSADPQLHLMTLWPEFEIVGRAAPATAFCLGRHQSQAIYAGISKETPYVENNVAWAGYCPWSMMAPEQRSWVSEPLSAFLVRLLNFEAGREFFEPDSTGCHWTTLIHYLLKTTFALPLRTRDMDPDSPRGIAVELNRAAVADIDGGFQPEYVPAERLAELAGGSGSPPRENQELNFGEGGQGRLIMIMTDQGHG
jgi:hypothetical protein